MRAGSGTSRWLARRTGVAVIAAAAMTVAAVGAVAAGAVAAAAPPPAVQPQAVARAAGPTLAQGPVPGAGPVAHQGPVIGYDTWYEYDLGATEANALTQARALKASGLQAAGYNLITLDDGWQGTTPAQREAGVPLTWSPARYPHGIPWLARQLHALGFSLGIYTAIGINTCFTHGFADFIAGRVPTLAGITANMGDFADHVTTAFTDVRLKRFLEMRGADAGRADMMLAQSALWVGLLYDDAALSAAEALLRGATWHDAVTARAAVPRQGLDTPWRGASLRAIAADVVAIANDGLRARARRDSAGDDETGYLDPLRAIAAGAPTQAEHWLACYHGAWNGDVTRIFQEAAI